VSYFEAFIPMTMRVVVRIAGSHPSYVGSAVTVTHSVTQSQLIILAVAYFRVITCSAIIFCSQTVPRRPLDKTKETRFAVDCSVRENPAFQRATHAQFFCFQYLSKWRPVDRILFKTRPSHIPNNVSSWVDVAISLSTANPR
jgi:hypothetical protein